MTDLRCATARPRGARRWLAGAVVASLLLTAGCSDGGDDDSAGGTTSSSSAADGSTTTGGEQTTATSPSVLEAEEVPAEDGSFYDVPDPMPAGAHGDLVRYQVTGDQPEGLTRYRVMYLSETVTGDPTVVTGLVAVPDGEAPDGGWPVLTYARGSSGIADDCAISMAIDGTQGADSVLAAEAWLVEDAVVEHDMVATVTDYEGIGGPGIHPFLSGVSEARATLDIVRAAGDLPGLDLRDDVGIMGYSQGGHAALWANQEAGGWTPELVVHGTVSGAPASEVASLLGPDGIFEKGSASLLAAGMAQEDPALDIEELLTLGGVEYADLMAASCRPDPAAVVALMEDPLLQEDPATSDTWQAWIEENTPGNAPAASPVLIVHGDADANVPVEDSEALRARLCAGGTPTERRVVPGADHIAGAIPTIADGTAWLAGLIAGTQAPPTC